MANETSPLITEMLYDELAEVLSDSKYFDLTTAAAIGVLELLKHSLIDG